MDVFGAAAKDRFEGAEVSLVIERDDGYENVDDLGSYFSTFESFKKCEKDALDLARGRVLDLGLGPGRVSLALQEKGLDVVGVDLSDEMLEVARRRGVKEAVKMSVCDLRFPKHHFQTVIAFGNNFGLCGTPEGVMSMLLRLREIVSDDGVFLAQSIDPLNTTTPEHLRYHEANRSRGRFPGHVRLRFRYKDMVGEWFDLLMVTPTEMKVMAEKTGWRVSQVFYAPEDDPFCVHVLRKA